MKAETPAHVSTVTDSLKAGFIDYTDDIKDVGNVSLRQVERVLEEFCELNWDYVIHNTSKKFGRLMYNKSWDMISTWYEVARTKTSNIYEMDMHTSLKKQHVTAKQMFHGVAEISKRLNKGLKLLDKYDKYPELLQTLTIADLIFTGINMKFKILTTLNSDYIPPVNPLLFSMF